VEIMGYHKTTKNGDRVIVIDNAHCISESEHEVRVEIDGKNTCLYKYEVIDFEKFINNQCGLIVPYWLARAKGIV
jgi:hypothetical protein